MDEKGKQKSKGDKICCLFPIIGIITIIVILIILINLNPPRSPSFENNIILISARQNLNYTEVINMDLEQIELDLNERGYDVLIDTLNNNTIDNWEKGIEASIYSHTSTDGLNIRIYATNENNTSAKLDVSYRNPGKEDDLEYYKNDIKEKVTEVSNIANVSVNVDQLKFVVSYDCS